MNQIHPTAVIGPDVELGERNVVGPYAIILGPCRIGDDNWIGPSVAVGTPGEIRGSRHAAAWDEGSGGLVVIGSRNVIREFTTVQVAAGTTTLIGDDCYIMTKAHVPHDAVLADGVTVACTVMIGGHGRIGAGANLGLGAVLHQRLAVGEGAMVGMSAVVTRPIPPFAMAYGSPARITGANRVGMSRRGFADADIEAVAALYADADQGWLAVDVPACVTDAFAQWREDVRLAHPAP